MMAQGDSEKTSKPTFPQGYRQGLVTAMFDTSSAG
jgi:hypothetical protein